MFGLKKQLKVASAVALLAGAGVASPVQADLPSMKIGSANIGTVDNAISHFASLTASHTDNLPNVIAPEIAALAKSLNNDPDLIYAYVKNTIELTPLFGLKKSAVGTMVDGAGTAFDQAHLMVNLLKAAGYDAKYAVGKVSLSGQQFEDFYGISDAKAACQLMGYGGIPASLNGKTSCGTVTAGDAISSVHILHAFVELQLGGFTYIFDPAHKQHKTFDGIDVADAMGYSRSTFNQSATATDVTENTDPTAPDYMIPAVEDVSLSGVNSKLETYSSALLTELQTNHQGKSLTEIIGGKMILTEEVPAGGWRMARTDYDYTIASGYKTFGYDNLPDYYRTKLTVQAGASTATFFEPVYFDEVYGRKLELKIGGYSHTINDPDNTPVLQAGDKECAFAFPLNATVSNGGPICTGVAQVMAALSLDGQTIKKSNGKEALYPLDDWPTYRLNSQITLKVDHPYLAVGADGVAGHYMDESFDVGLDFILTSNIVVGSGQIGNGWVSKIEEEFGPDTVFDLQNTPGAPGADEPGGIAGGYMRTSDKENTKAKIGAAWLAQFSKLQQILGGVKKAEVLHHHTIGLSYSEVELKWIALDGTDYTDPYGSGWGRDVSDALFFPSDDNLKLNVVSGISVLEKSPQTLAAENVGKENALAHAVAAGASTLEGVVFKQILDIAETSSTAVRFSWAEDSLSSAKYLQMEPGDEDQINDLILQNGWARDGEQRPDYLRAYAPVLFTDGQGNYSETRSVWPAGTELEVIVKKATIEHYLADNYTAFTVNDEFLGPGYEYGTPFIKVHAGANCITFRMLTTCNDDVYKRTSTKQRGAAFVAQKKNGDRVTEIAHIVTSRASGSTLGSDDAVLYKGGGGGTQADESEKFDVAKAADILKDEFEDKSSMLGVDLASGKASWSSGPLLSVGSGGFPYELTYELTFNNNFDLNQDFQTPLTEVSTFQHNLRTDLVISGSGMEAMGASNPFAAVGTIAALYVSADVMESESLTNVVRMQFVNSFWEKQLHNNVVSISGSTGGAQFVRLPGDMGFIAPAGSPGELEETSGSERTLMRDNTCDSGDPAGYKEVNAYWNYGSLAFTYTDGSQNTTTFSAKSYDTDSGICGKTYHKFAADRYEAPTGFGVDYNYGEEGTIYGDVFLTSVENDFGRRIVLDKYGASDDHGRSVSFDFDHTSALGYVTVTDVNGGVTRLEKATDHTDARPRQTNHFLAPASPTVGRMRRGFNLGAVYLPDDANTPALQYEYDQDHRVVAIKDKLERTYQVRVAPGFRGEREDPLGNSYAVYYGERALAEDLTDGPDFDNGTLVRYGRFINEKGESVRTEFDGFGRVKGRAFPDGRRTEFDYDSHSNVTAKRMVPNDGSATLTASATYHATFNKPLTVTDFGGNTVTLCYGTTADCDDGDGLVRSATLPQVDTDLIVDAEGNDVAGYGAVDSNPTYLFDYNGFGQPTKMTDPEGLVTFNSYYSVNADSAAAHTNGELKETIIDYGTSTSEVTYLNLTSTFTYDAIGNVLSANGPLSGTGDTITTFYDDLRRPTYVYQADLAGTGISQTNPAPTAKSGIESYGYTVYDDLGRATTQTAAGLRADRKLYIRQDAEKSYTKSDSTPCNGSGLVCRSWSTDDVETQVSYDALDRPEVVTTLMPSAADRKVRTVYDALSRVTSVYKAYTSVDEILYQRYGYTDAGQVAWVMDANCNATTYHYDGHGRLEATYFPPDGSRDAVVDQLDLSCLNADDQNWPDEAPSSGSHTYGDREEYRYDANGNIVAKRTRAGDWIVSDFDALNRVEEKRTYKGGSWTASGGATGTLEKTVQYAYYKDGRDKQVHQSEGTASVSGTRIPEVTLTYGYDKAHRPVSETIRYEQPAVVEADPVLVTRTVAVEVDAAGNRTKLTLPGVGTVGDAKNDKVIDFVYDVYGRMTQVKEGSTTHAEYAYDGLSRRLSLTRLPDDKDITTTYGYQPNDNVLSKLTHKFTGAGNAANVAYTYGLNEVNQITSRILSNTAYKYQEGGPTTRTFARNGLNQYDSYTDDGGLPKALSYNGNGSLETYYDENGNAGSYAYDIENRLVLVTKPDGNKVRYEYDPKGRRLAVDSDSKGRKEFLYEGDEPIADYIVDDNGGTFLKARYLHGSGIDERLAYWQYDTATGELATHEGTSDPIAQYYITNHQGSVVAMAQMDSGNRLGDPLTYDAYGKIKSGDGGGQPFRYTGRRWDEETGLYYYRARYYSADLGRFLQTDPIGYEDNMNMYGYVGNDPVNMVDPTGMFGSGIGIADMMRDGMTLNQALRLREQMTPTREGIHTSLDAAGLVPGVGIVPDVLNAIIYAVEGDFTNAGLSAGAAVPGVGQAVTATKWGSRIVRSSDDLLALMDKAPRQIAGLDVHGIFELTGSTYQADILAIKAIENGKGNIFGLVKELKNEATEAGAGSLRIVAHHVVNADLKTIIDKAGKRSGITINQVGEDAIEIVVDIQ